MTWFVIILGLLRGLAQCERSSEDVLDGQDFTMGVVRQHSFQQKHEGEFTFGTSKVKSVKTGPLPDPPAQMQFTFREHMGDTRFTESESKPTIYMGPVLGVRYNSGIPGYSGEQPISGGSDYDEVPSPFCLHYLNYYANHLPTEFSDDNLAKLRKGTEGFEELTADPEQYIHSVALEVLSNMFMFSAAETRDKAADIREAFNIAINNMKAAGTTPDNNVETAQIFLDATDKIIPRAALPEQIARDPWILGGTVWGTRQWEKNHTKGGVGIGEYVLVVMWLRHHIRARVWLQADRLKSLGVTTVVSMLEQRQQVAVMNPYTEPHDGTKELNAVLPPSADTAQDVLNTLEDTLGLHVESDAFLVNDDYLLDNVYTNTLADANLKHFWPAFGDYSIPLDPWTKRFRNVIAPNLVNQLKMGNSLYLHCMGGNGRTGLVATLVLMEATGAFWRDAIHAVRVARPKAVETAQQELYIAWYWATMFDSGAERYGDYRNKASWIPAEGSHYKSREVNYVGVKMELKKALRQLGSGFKGKV